MALSPSDKERCMIETIKITHAYAGREGASPGSVAKCLEEVTCPP